MNKKQLRWALSGTLVLIFALSMGLNATILSHGSQQASQTVTTLDNEQGVRGLASMPKYSTSWEKRTFEGLEAGSTPVDSKGQNPSDLDQLALGRLQGRYGIKLKDGRVSAIQLTEDQQASVIPNPTAFLNQHRSLLGSNVESVRRVFSDDNGTTSLQRFELLTRDGQAIGLVSLTLDNEQGLLSANVQ